MPTFIGVLVWQAASASVAAKNSIKIFFTVAIINAINKKE